MNNSHLQFGNGNFAIAWNFRDMFPTSGQKNPPRIGDMGEVSEKFVKNAKDRQKYKQNTFHDLAKDPSKFTAPEFYGTGGRPENRNYNRMEYDPVERNDGKSHADVMETLDKTTDNIAESLKKFSGKWDVNTTASAFGTDPLKADDYDEYDW